jgi:hypothetical protein
LGYATIFHLENQPGHTSVKWTYMSTLAPLRSYIERSDQFNFYMHAVMQVTFDATTLKYASHLGFDKHWVEVVRQMASESSQGVQYSTEHQSFHL